MDSNEPRGEENASWLGDHGNVAARATTSASESASSLTEGTTPTAAAAAAAVPADGTPVIASLSSPSVPSQFPDKLMALLEKKVATEAVWWLRDMGAVTGAFAINRKVFSEKLLDVAFNGNKFPSITRNLNRWGYKQISYPNLPGQTTAYFNPLFQRNRPDLLKIMVKDKSKAKAAIQQFEMKMAQKSTSVTSTANSSANFTNDSARSNSSAAGSSNSGDHGQGSHDAGSPLGQKSLRDSLLRGRTPGQSINLIRSATLQASPVPANPQMLSMASNLKNSDEPNQESTGSVGVNQPMGIGNKSEISIAGLMYNSNNPGSTQQQLPESVLHAGATGVTNINRPAEDSGFVSAQALLHSLLTDQESVDNLAKQLEEQQGSCLWPSSQQGVSLSSQGQPPQQQSGGRHLNVLQHLQHQEDMLRGQLELGQQRQRQQELQQQFELQQRQQREQQQQAFNRQQEAHLVQLRQNFLRLQEQQQEEMQHQQLDPLLVPLQRNEQQQVQLQHQFQHPHQRQQEEEQKMQREHQQQQLQLVQLSQQFHQQRQLADLAQQQQQQLGQGLSAGGFGSLSNSPAEDPTSAIVAAAAAPVAPVARANYVNTSRLSNEELSYQQQQAILQEIFRRQQQQRQQE